MLDGLNMEGLVGLGQKCFTRRISVAEYTRRTPSDAPLDYSTSSIGDTQPLTGTEPKDTIMLYSNI
jgi:hypothetical protein